MQFQNACSKFEHDVEALDTGNEANDSRRRNVLRMGLSFIKHTLKTNFFRMNYAALCFRLDPKYLDDIPFDRKRKFPVMPFAIFFMRGMQSFGFHIRFKDLSRGGLRTVYLEHPEQMQHESNNIFTECYNLALTQHMKNKDIPEGGSKGIIFLRSGDRIDSEAFILQGELETAGIAITEIEGRIIQFRKEQREEFLYQAQRSFIESLITVVNCEPNGTIRAKYIVDYYKKPEYIYLGPDENMHDSMINWIAGFSKKYNYKPGGAFISGKPDCGINHKEYGVTSLGVNVYMEAVLRYLGIDPTKEKFTIKISGGPDGDVAGNEILNLARYYPSTAKLVALTDISGSIYDPHGLDLQVLVELFKQGRPIKYYPPENLADGGFLLDKRAKRSQTAFAQQTLCWKKQKDKLIEEWMPGSEMNQLLRSNIHQTKADIFIPAGGRPRTLNEGNVKEFLDESGKPTAKAIIEGANLYLTPGARRILEKMGVLIIKDSSANKTGVICSSFEVLCGLALGDEKFMANKSALVQEILQRLHACASNEAQLLLNTHKETGHPLTDIAEQISEHINLFTYQLLDYLDTIPLEDNRQNPLIQCFFDYCLPVLKNRFSDELLKQIPEHHKKAIIACHLGSQLVYRRGLSWKPTIVDILPVLLEKF
jgi:glutamate dehydrogenase